MLNSVFGTMAKKLAKTAATTAATTVLEGVSYVGDKVAEGSDELQEWVENLDKKDISTRESRNEKRNDKES